MPKKIKFWNKCRGHHSLYHGNPCIDPTIAEVCRDKYSAVRVEFNINPSTGKPWKSMTEAREWVDKHV